MDTSFAEFVKQPPAVERDSRFPDVRSAVNKEVAERAHESESGRN